MKIDKNILQGYENMRLVRFEDSLNLPNTFAFDELPKRAVRGVLKASWHCNGKENPAA